MDPTMLVVAFCLSLAPVQDVAQKFANGEAHVGRSIFNAADDCVTLRRPLRVDETWSPLEVVSGEGGEYVIAVTTLKGRTIYSFRKFQGEAA